MSFKTKALWVEDLSGDDQVKRTIRDAATMGATAIYAYSTNAALPDAIKAFQDNKLKVYAWQWAHTTPQKNKDGTPNLNDPRFVPNEINNVVNILIPKGIDGYVFDVESNDGVHYAPDKKPYAADWDNPDLIKPPPGQKSLLDLATDYTGAIQTAFSKRATPYSLGLTSHARGFSNYPDIPWLAFLKVCTVLFPQTYWRYNEDGAPVDENKNKDGLGTPEQAVLNGYTDYQAYLKKHGLQREIVPLAGEIASAKIGEMKRFAAAIAPHSPQDAQFYVDADDSIEVPGQLGDILSEIGTIK